MQFSLEQIQAEKENDIYGYCDNVEEIIKTIFWLVSCALKNRFNYGESILGCNITIVLQRVKSERRYTVY